MINRPFASTYTLALPKWASLIDFYIFFFFFLSFSRLIPRDALLYSGRTTQGKLFVLQILCFHFRVQNDDGDQAL